MLDDRIIDIRVINGDPTKDFTVQFLKFFEGKNIVREVWLILDPLLRVRFSIERVCVELLICGKNQKEQHQRNKDEVEDFIQNSGDRIMFLHSRSLPSGASRA